MNCIFCKKELDGSDEHIIPDSLNGRMHSKRIICHDCNSNIFGKHIDPVGKVFFNPLLLAFQFKNARSMYVYDAEGDLYLSQRDGDIKKVKPEVIKTKIGSKTKLQVIGDPKNAIKLYNKEAEKLVAEGKISGEPEIKGILSDGVPFKSETVFEFDPKLRLLFNKIAFEFLAYKGMDLSKYDGILKSIIELDEGLKNVLFCNNDFEIREIGSKELTHLIKPIVVDGNLIVYIELFNVLCAIVHIDSDYKDDLNVPQYYQNAIDGARINEEVKLDERQLLEHLQTKDFEDDSLEISELIGRAFGVIRVNAMFEKLEQEVEKPILKLKEDLDKGKITTDEYDELSMHTMIETMARLSIDEFPYMFDEIHDELDNTIHYLHSNLREEQFDEFCEKNGHLIGNGIIDPVGNRFKIIGFEHYPVIVKNGVSVVKVFVVIEGESGKHRLPYKEVFEMEPIKEPKK